MSLQKFLARALQVFDDLSVKGLRVSTVHSEKTTNKENERAVREERSNNDLQS